MSAGDVEGFAIDPTVVRAWKRYPAYKDSGVDWLGEVPAGWDVIRSKFCMKINMGQSPSSEDCNLEGIGIPFLQGTAEFGEIHPSPRQYCTTAPKIALKDEILISVRAPVGSLNIADQKYGIGRGLCSITPDMAKLKSSFTWYLLHHVRDQLNCKAVGSTYDAVVAGDVGNLVCPLPPLFEQHAIAAFLDRETTRLDALIEKKQRFIELLEEKRQALISHAVTKGLDPDAEMKDSGIEWLGKVPKHWQLTRLKFLSTLQTGLTLGKKYSEDQPLAIRPYLRVANVQEGYFDLNTITEIRIPPEDVTRYELQPDDVLMTEGGDYDKLGRGSVWEGQIPGCLHQNHIFAVRPSPSKLKSRFLAAVTASSHGKNYFTSTSQQTTNLATTNSTKLQSLPVPVPPIVEQEEIVAFIQNMNNTMRELISKVESSIEKLHEYRTALIAAAVTGKIDVRGEGEAA